MKPIVTSVEELYDRKDGTGEVLLDEMAECLRKTRIIAVADLAALMDVDAHQLNQAVRLLTGMTTRDVRRCGWRSYRVLLKVAHRYGVKL